MSTMRVVICRPGGQPEVSHIETGLAAMQAVVDGYIECVSVTDLDVWVNEDGLSGGLPFNRVVAGVALVGTILVASSTEDGETVGLSDSQVTTALGLLYGIDA